MSTIRWVVSLAVVACLAGGCNALVNAYPPPPGRVPLEVLPGYNPNYSISNFVLANPIVGGGYTENHGPGRVSPDPPIPQLPGALLPLRPLPPVEARVPEPNARARE